MTLQIFFVQLRSPVLVTSDTNSGHVYNNVVVLSNDSGRALRQRCISLSSCLRNKIDYHRDDVRLADIAYR